MLDTHQGVIVVQIVDGSYATAVAHAETQVIGCLLGAPGERQVVVLGEGSTEEHIIPVGIDLAQTADFVFGFLAGDFSHVGIAQELHHAASFRQCGEIFVDLALESYFLF